MWVGYSLFFAIWSALQTFLVKKLTKKINPVSLLYTFFLFNIPITFILLLFIGGIPKVTGNFYLYMGIAGLLDAVAFISSYLAISKSSISLISPIASFAPVFTTIIAAFTIHEIPTPIKFVGILTEVRQNIKWFFVNGIGTAFAQAAAYAAYSLVFVGYATSIFRLSSLFVIIIAGVFLKEERIKERLLGGSVMVMGAILPAV